MRPLGPTLIDVRKFASLLPASKEDVMKTTLFIRNVSSQTGILVYLATALILANCGKSQDPSASSLVGVRAVLEGQAETGYIPDPNASGSGSDGGYYLPPNPDSTTSTSTDTQSSPTDSNTTGSETLRILRRVRILKKYKVGAGV